MATQFRKPDGSFTTDRSYAHHIAPSDALAIWRTLSSTIPGRFIIGTIQHESDFIVNERSPGDQGDGSPSDGLTQASRTEAIKAGKPLADLMDAEDNLTVYAITQHRNLDRLHDLIAGKALGDPSDVWAWLSMCWNQGFGAVQTSINKNGAAYSGAGGYRERNKNLVHAGYDGPAIMRYCDDVISGGKYWQASWDDLPPADGSVSDPVNVALGIGTGIAAGILLKKLLT
jgi:hypothetical protein